ncbi:hypothetical protein DVH24_028846 [Malus domestica]|uniref:Uncharacterized protein n=1 Tax=Malus domestica TaxID=3750 RepID=A0A498IVS0_MALDO|nr:hypothetical protein DVH24_028846 [Malus domestica]
MNFYIIENGGHGVRIGTESLASHSSIASNITTANSITNLQLNVHDNLVMSGAYLVLLIINTFLLLLLMVTLATHYPPITDAYAHLKDVYCQHGQTQVGQNNTLSIWFLLKQQLKKPCTYQAQIHPRGLSLPQMSSRNMQNVTVKILSRDDEDN